MGQSYYYKIKFGGSKLEGALVGWCVRDSRHGVGRLCRKSGRLDGPGHLLLEVRTPRSAPWHSFLAQNGRGSAGVNSHICKLGFRGII